MFTSTRRRIHSFTDARQAYYPLLNRPGSILDQLSESVKQALERHREGCTVPVLGIYAYTMPTSLGTTPIPNDPLPQLPKENIAQGVNQRSAPTDSMITIRLSDTRKDVAEGPSSFEDNGISGYDSHSHSRNSRNDELLLQSAIQVCNIELERVDYSGEEYDELTEHSHQTSSPPSLEPSHPEEATLEHRRVSSISRRDSVRSTSSSESAHVDWEELDKNEEEEQREEGSDAVSILRIRVYFWSMAD